MPRPLPASLAEALIDPVNTTPEATDVARVLGGIGLPTDREIGRMPSDRQEDGLEAPTSWEVATDIHTATTKLFSEIFSDSLRVPELRDFADAGIDLAQLQAGYEAYEQAGLKPELLIAPINLPLARWKNNYTELRKWQDVHHPGSTFRLQNRADGDGLYVWSGVADNWDSLNDQAEIAGHQVIQDGVSWGILVLPTASSQEGGLAVNTSYDLTTSNISNQAELLGIPEGDITPANAHVPIGAYLTAQALRIAADKPLLDTDTWTWNIGTFKEDENLRAPASYWYPTYGRVRVGRDVVDLAVDNLGARLPVWGIKF